MATKERVIRCPRCRRTVTINVLFSGDVEGRPVLTFHLNPRTGLECRSTRPGIFGYRHEAGHGWVLMRSYGPRSELVTRTGLSLKAAERLCLRANLLLGRIRGGAR